MVLFGSSGKNARLIGTGLLIMTFIAGGLAGAAVIHVVNAERPHALRNDSPMRGGPRRLLLDEQFSKELGLTADQRTRIKDILDRRDAQAKQLWQSVEPRLHEFGKQVHDEIQKVLTPDQQKKLDAAIEQRRASFRKRHECAPADSSTAAHDTAAASHDSAAAKEKVK
jgi:Spy/CpxP family protein refolding chaperone